MTRLNETIEHSLDWRYAVKKFDPSRKISDADWQTLSQALVKAPSSYGLQPWKFIVVQNPELRAKLREISWGQAQVTDSSHFVVFVSSEAVTADHVDKYLNRIQSVRGVPPESLTGFRDVMTKNLVQGLGDKALGWTQRQAYIAMGFLLESAALLQIDATPMEGLDPAAYDKALGLEGTGWKAVAAVALGYRHPDDAFQAFKKVRFAADDVIQYK